MSDEVGKAVQSVLERVNQAAARRLKVTAARTELRARARGSSVSTKKKSGVREPRLVM